MLQSHTATQQWQSFEIRMRRRRIERCALRASAAIEAGVLDDARAAIDEIRRLAPLEPALEALTAQLQAAEAAPAAAVPLVMVAPAVEAAPGTAPPTHTILLAGASRLQEPDTDAQPRRGRALPIAIAASLVAMSGAAGWFWFSPRPFERSAALHTQTAVAEPVGAPAPSLSPGSAVRLSQMAVKAPATTERTIEEDVPTAAAGADTVALPAPPPIAPAADASRTTADLPVPAVDNDAPRATAVAGERPASVANLAEPAAASEMNAAPPAVATGTDGVALSDTSVSLAAPLPAPPAPPAATVSPSNAPASTAAAPSDERMVRAVLNRYEAAYGALDAAAARAVWPNVDQRALASAFQGLSAQSVSLGRCDILISGATARAECKGTAKWNPKVGGGPQTASRQWRFDLRNAGGQWLISQATVK